MPSKYMKAILMVVLAIIVFGIFGPFLISAASNVAVLIGICLVVATGWFLFRYLRNLLNTEESDTDD